MVTLRVTYSTSPRVVNNYLFSLNYETIKIAISHSKNSI